MFLKTKRLLLLALIYATSGHAFYPTQSLNHGIGLITIPSARMLKEGYISFNYSSFDPYNHYRFSLQPYDWLEASFFYSDINTIRYNLGTGGQSYKDKGFSIKFRINEEDGFYPQISLGLEDFSGTGIQSSEYLVANKSTENFDITFGIGWGRLGSSKMFENPFSALSDDFQKRNTFSSTNKNISGSGGVPEFSNWFKGDISLFGGVEYKLSNTISLKADYDPIDYKTQYGYQCSSCEIKDTSKLNYGISFQPYENFDFGLYIFQDEKLSFRFSLKNNFSKKNNTKIKLNRKNYSSRETNKIYIDLLNELSIQNVFIQKATITEDKKLTLNYAQTLSNNEIDIARALHDEITKNYPIEEVVFIPQNSRLNLAEIEIKDDRVIMKESNLHNINEFQFQPKVKFPAHFFSGGLGHKTHIGSPSGFVFGEINLSLNSTVVFNNELEFNARYSYALYDNYEDLNYDPAYTGSEPVRVDIQSYLKEGKRSFDNFSLSYLKQLGSNEYSFLSIGELESMFGGIYFEYLRKNFHSFFSYGFDIAYVKQRQFSKKLFQYKDYSTIVGNLNIYAYEPKFKIDAKISIGRYLAKDLGITFDFGRRFKNGLKIGAFFTLTDMPDVEYGEGSFDKGIYVSFPLGSFGGKSSKGYRSEIYKPLTRDGGAKLNIMQNLYDLTRYSTSKDS